MQRRIPTRAGSPDGTRHVEEKIFGLGLSRTGTKSLAVALNTLGIKTRWYPHDYQTYYDIVRGHYRLRVLEEYDAVTDTPVVPFYPQFDELFPSSKFILTTRDKEGWLKSCRKNWKEKRCQERMALLHSTCFYNLT